MRSPRVSPAQSVSTMRSFCLSTSLCSPMTHGNRNGSASLSRRLGRGAPPVYQMEFICRTSSDFFGELSGYRLCRARPGLFAIEHQGGLLSPPTRLGGVAVSMGLRPRLSAAAAFAAYWNPRVGARGIISLRIVGATAGGREVASPPSQLGWRKPLEPVAAIIERNMDRQDRQNRLVLHPVHPVDPCKTRIEVRTWMADEGS